jgi:hypothetical protein
MTIAGIALQRDRLMGIGQAITMPLFFSSSALYPTRIMPGWLQAISKVNPLTYEVEGLRGLLIAWPGSVRRRPPLGCVMWRRGPGSFPAGCGHPRRTC